jgi:transposase
VVSGELWAWIELLLPVIPHRAGHPGRRRLDDRKVMSGILFVLYTGIPWEFLPQELGVGSGMTCWRRLHLALLAALHAAGALDWSRAVIDSSHVRALERRPETVPGQARSTT